MSLVGWIIVIVLILGFIASIQDGNPAAGEIAADLAEIVIEEIADDS